jgi:hypothetical protein
MTAIPTIDGYKTPDQSDISYMDYLDNHYDAPDYGLLLFKADPTAFELGKEQWRQDLAYTEYLDNLYRRLNRPQPQGFTRATQ